MNKQKIYLVAMNLSQTSVSPTTNLMIEMAKGFRKAGCICEIIELATKEPRDAHAPFRTMVLNSRMGFLYTLDIIKGLRSFAETLVLEKQQSGIPSLVVAVSLYPVFVLWLAKFCRKQSIPSFVYIFEEWVSLLLYDDIPLLRKWMGAIRRIPSSILLYAICTRLVAGVVVIVEDMQHFLVRRFRVDANKIFCFPNVVAGEGGQCSVNSTQCSVSGKRLVVSVEEEKAGSRETGDSDQLSSEAVNSIQCSVNSDQCSVSGKSLVVSGGETGRYVVFGGALSFTKDAMSKTLEALALLKNRGLVIGLRIYGKVGGRQHQRLMREACQLNIEKQIRFMGYVERDVLERDLQQAIASLIVKCNMPFNRYNFPTKMMDALKLRVPMIVSTGSLFKRYFTDRVSACLADPDCAEKIADSIAYLAEHPKEAREMAEQAHKLLDDEFNAEAVCRRFLKKFGLSL